MKIKMRKSNKQGYRLSLSYSSRSVNKIEAKTLFRPPSVMVVPEQCRTAHRQLLPSHSFTIQQYELRIEQSIESYYRENLPLTWKGQKLKTL